MGWEWGGKEGGYLQTGRALMYCMQYDMTLFHRLCTFIQQKLEMEWQDVTMHCGTDLLRQLSVHGRCPERHRRQKPDTQWLCSHIRRLRVQHQTPDNSQATQVRPGQSCTNVLICRSVMNFNTDWSEFNKCKIHHWLTNPHDYTTESSTQLPKHLDWFITC